MKLWIRNAQPRLATSDTTSRGLENQLGRNQVKIKIRKKFNQLIDLGSSK